MIIGKYLLKYDSLSSTNAFAARLLKYDDPEEGTVIQAGYQTNGRGQGNNKWDSDKDNNLLISIILFPELIRPDEHYLINIFVSLGICDYLDLYFPGSRIKKPNDIYFGNDKMAGILIENSIIDDQIINSIVGIGLNVNQTIFPADIPNPTSQKIVTGKTYDLDDCLRNLLAALDARYKFVLYGDRSLLEEEYSERLIRQDS
jgi:BirA family biotin operon repressor/biotin-[acetyl-CoA-carboxylase] ligase